MKLRLITAAGLMLALAGCTTAAVTTSSRSNGVDTRWRGQSAGVFFAKFGPPISDVQSGSDTLFTWRGAYRTRTSDPQYAPSVDGKRGKLISGGRKEYLRCEVQLTVSSDYMIRGVKTVIDKPGVGSAPSYCEEFLAGA
jgi:hypothetical protein